MAIDEAAILDVGRTRGARMSRNRDRQISMRRESKSSSVFTVKLPDTEPGEWPAISVCMIVKNEESNLRPCLESLGDLASEVIVVDTGSTDNTVEIAQSMGAQVYYFQWIDDFAAARNASLRHAAGEWVFWLDADDRLDARAVALLKTAAACRYADAYQCQVVSVLADGREDVTEHIRLFRNHLGISFSYPIHETVIPSILPLGLRLGLTDISIEHVGYSSSDHEITDKARRNLPIIEKAMRDDPDNLDLLYYRGQAKGHLGDMAGTEEDLLTYLSRTKPRPVPFFLQRFWCYVSLSSVYSVKRDWEASKNILLRALSEFPNHPFFLVEKAFRDLEEGKHDRALVRLQAAQQAMTKSHSGLMPSESRLALGLAWAYRDGGEIDGALPWAELAYERLPNDPRAGSLLASLLLQSGRVMESESLLTRLLRDTMASDPWVVLYDIRIHQRRFDEAREALWGAQARGLSPERAEELQGRLEALQLKLALGGEIKLPAALAEYQLEAMTLLKNGHYLAAAEGFSKVIEAIPTEPENYRLLSVALERLGEKEKALEVWQIGEYWSGKRGWDDRDTPLYAE